MDNTTYSAEVAEAVRSAMADKGVTLNALSIVSGISRGSLTRRLHGPTPFTVAELASIAGHLDVPVESLVAPGVAA